jgi:hypothetical protein
MKKVRSEEEQKALEERLAKARAAKEAKRGKPKYSMYSPLVVELPDDDPLSLKNVREWIKEAKATAAAFKKQYRYGDKKALSKYHMYDAYANQLQSYLRTGTYISNYQGGNMEKKTKFKCIAMGYYKDGRPKRQIGVWYPDVQAEWTVEMDDSERAAYGLKPHPWPKAYRKNA